MDLPMSRLTTFLLKKLVRLVILLFAVSTISFILISASPIDPVDAYLRGAGVQVGPEQRELIAQRYGLDESPPLRYGRWLAQIAQGNLGNSIIFTRPMLQVIGDRFLTSLWLMATAWILSGVVGFGLGVLAGAKQGSWIDQAIRFYAYTLASTPTFWLALLLLIVFAVWLRVSPVCCASPAGVPVEAATFWQRIQHLILPAAALSIIGVANIALHTRQKLIDVLHSDYALFARAQGETNAGLIVQHGLRNIALPAITLQFASLSELFGGSVLAEQVFAYPGLGEATVQAGLRGDVPLLLGIVLFSAVFVFIGNTVADVAYHLIDPRIRIGGAA
ncbi:MAG: ABC transporter permease [Anaerolineales bacterium]|nr:ABC transporter permease [Anaerolineales bacterium]